MFPHEDKLTSLKRNSKMPKRDKVRLDKLIEEYYKFRKEVENIFNLDAEVSIDKLCELANKYKFYMDFEFIFKSKDDFLYRQKGQLKLESSFLEELMIYVIKKALPDDLVKLFHIGPTKGFSRLYFGASVASQGKGGRIKIKTKDHDVAIARKLFLRTSFKKSFSEFEEASVFVSFICIECKTNLDKTMFQEAIATSSELKSSVLSAKYYLVCEWLDMTPISTSLTPIDEVIILRGKRISSSIREQFASYEGRRTREELYRDFLLKHPIRCDSLKRIYEHVRSIVYADDINTEEVLKRGYF